MAHAATDSLGNLNAGDVIQLRLKQNDEYLSISRTRL